MNMKKVREIQNLFFTDPVLNPNPAKRHVPEALHKYRAKRIAKKKVAKVSRKANRSKG